MIHLFLAGVGDQVMGEWGDRCCHGILWSY